MGPEWSTSITTSAIRMDLHLPVSLLFFRTEPFSSNCSPTSRFSVVLDASCSHVSLNSYCTLTTLPVWYKHTSSSAVFVILLATVDWVHRWGAALSTTRTNNSHAFYYTRFIAGSMGVWKYRVFFVNTLYILLIDREKSKCIWCYKLSICNYFISMWNLVSYPRDRSSTENRREMSFEDTNWDLRGIWNKWQGLVSTKTNSQLG